ncbi:MAG: 50S ribosomal protein L17 [Enterobacteriaceae bacterium]
MKHRKIGRKFNRNSSHRKMMLRNLSISIIRNEQIRTTIQKAKEIKRFIEPIINLSKKDTVHNRRIIFSKIRDNFIVSKLFNVIGPRLINYQGGYIRILKDSNRKGDSANMSYVQIVDFSLKN